MSIAIQERDVEAMKFVYAFRAVNYSQVIRKYFSGISERVARKRILRLVDEGYLKKISIVHNRKSQVVLLPREKSWEVIGKKWPFEIDNPLFKSEYPEHDVRLAELFLRLEKLKCFRNFFSENILQSSSVIANDTRSHSASRMQADGLLSIELVPGKFSRYAVELEISRKSPAAYQKKLVKYYWSQGIEGILYITANADIDSAILGVDSEICKDNEAKVYLADETTALSSHSGIIFKNRKGHLIELQ